MFIDKTHRRKFSLDMDFMAHQTDDLLLGWMLAIASAKTENNKTFAYLTINNFNKEKKQIMDILGISAKTLKRHLDDLKARGLVAEEERQVNEMKSEMVYVFPVKSKKFNFINRELLYYLITTRNRCSVKIYLFLLNWYVGKKREDSYYIFTNKDIIRALGYSESSKTASSMITNIIDDLNKRGIIYTADYFELFTTPEGKEIPLPKQKLLFVAQTIDDMEEVYIQQARNIIYSQVV